ncbi:hypothetical protein L249_1254 [Ophiocordyceps polyrhachis-furcata BCC 54312]|uniref:Uncharacterized protein n=1 Tax=Ophiocordyceps polyrhachis-furcata BCC 54312 TaxID=1330021 RepID=A0A367LE51_9HYPO|nr:hypothetical protein L249_1254 [Ophiocordyceps polyrhachis-furcata BCC 54312]
MDKLPYPDQGFVNSSPVDAQRIKQTGAFTRFASQISKHDDQADVGTRRARHDFSSLTGFSPSFDACGSPVGNFNSLLYFDCLPDRIEMLSYFTELAFLHDDYTASDRDESPQTRHKRLDYAMSLQGADKPDDLPLTMKMKRLYSEVILQCSAIDLRMTIDMVNSFSNHWLKGTRMTGQEFDTIEPLVHAAERVFLAVNDFYSWQKEKLLPAHRIWNCVLFFIKTELRSEQDAISRLRDFIVDEERLFLDRRAEFCSRNPHLPSHLKRMVNALEPAMGGYHYWCAVCPRQNSSSQSLPFELRSDEQSNGQVDEAAQESVPDHGLQSARSALTAPATYIRSMTSKNVRSQFIDAINLWLQVPQDKVTAIKQAIDSLHQSSLILDDIQDQSPLRRGKIATHHVFGEAQSINSATYMFVEATKQIHHVGNSTMTSILLQEMENLFLGQALDLNWKFTMHCPTRERYLAMVDQKTGSMFRLILRMLTSAIGKEPDDSLTGLSRLLGRWYQVRDDYLNLLGGEYTKKKGFCEDLDERKLSYPVVCCCARDSSARELILGIFRQRTSSAAAQSAPMPVEFKMQMLTLLKQSGALAETFRLVRELQTDVEAVICGLGETFGMSNPVLRLMVMALSDIPEPELPCRF